MTKQNIIFIYTRLFEIKDIKYFVSIDFHTKITVYNVIVKTENYWGGGNSITIGYLTEAEAFKTFALLSNLTDILPF